MRTVYPDRDEHYRKACIGSILSFKDVEDALESFSGNAGRSWVKAAFEVPWTVPRGKSHVE